jgi:hypothetical protein
MVCAIAKSTPADSSIKAAQRRTRHIVLSLSLFPNDPTTTTTPAASMSLGKNLTLSNGATVPQIGLGTWLSKPKEVENAVCHLPLPHDPSHSSDIYIPWVG